MLPGIIKIDLPEPRHTFPQLLAREKLDHTIALDIAVEHQLLSLIHISAAAAIKKAVELMADGCRDVCITDPDGRIHSHAEFDQLHAAERA